SMEAPIIEDVMMNKYVIESCDALEASYGNVTTVEECLNAEPVNTFLLDERNKGVGIENVQEDPIWGI
ncbi:hypothetical protein, partial [Escherichia coli]|uniref:hypothetical protein n=1 Tax=Escherichia coli TaxID=562 RepID=UPI00142E7CCC